MRRYSYVILLLALLLLAYGRFLWPSAISQGDWFYPLPDRSLFWTGSINYLSSLNLNAFLSYALVSAPLANLAHYLIGGLGFSVASVNSALYFWPSVVVMSVGMWCLASRIDSAPQYRFWATLIFTVNGFVLTLLVGGQLSGAIAYGLVAYILFVYDRILCKAGRGDSVLLALALYVQSVVEVRYLFITALALLFWSIGRGWSALWAARKSFTISLLLFVLLSFFWIYAIFFLGGTGLAPDGYTGVHWIKTLSYANWVDAVSLRHVWWPLGTEQTPTLHYWYLLIIPAVSLFSLKGNNRRMSIWLWIMVLAGAYLVNGLHSGEGSIYVWLYQTALGPLGFRDPAKFFTLIAVAESLLFASGLAYLLSRKNIAQWLMPAVALSLLVAYWPLWTQKTGGAFVKSDQLLTAVNNRLSEIDAEAGWGRVMWLPTTYRYAVARETLPFLMADDTTINRLRNRVEGLDQWLSGENAEVALPYVYRSLAAQYLAIPGDVTGEIFENNYAESSESYLKKVREVDGSLTVESVVDELDKPTYFLRTTGSVGRVYQSKKVVLADDPSVIPALSPGQNPSDVQVVWRSDVESSPQSEEIQEHVDAYWLSASSSVKEENIVLSMHVKPGQYQIWLPADLAWAASGPNTLTVGSDYKVIGERLHRSYLADVSSGQLEINLPLSSVPTDYSLSLQNTQYDCDRLGAISMTGSVMRGSCRLNEYRAREGVLITKYDGQNEEVWVNFDPVKDYRLQTKPGWLVVESPNVASDIRLVSRYDLAGAILLPKEFLPDALLLERSVNKESSLVDLQVDGDDFNGLTVNVDSEHSGFWLTVNNEYNPHWQMQDSQGNPLLHARSMLYQNMWFVPAGTLGSLKLVFTPDEAIRTFMGISNWSLLLLLGLVSVQKWIQRPRVSAM